MKPGRVCTVGGSGVGLSFRVPRRALVGETLVSHNLSYVNGGKAANQAIGAAKLGSTSCIITVIGSDPMGDLATATLRQHGVDVAGVVIDNQAATMLGVLMIEPSGENSIVIGPGALSSMSAATIDSRADMIRSSDVCLVSLEIPVPAAAQALSVARASGVLTILNPAPATEPSAIRQLLPLCDVITPNETEAQFLTGETKPERQAAAMIESGARAVVITLGSSGALVQSRGGQAVMVPAVPVRVVDTSGAGDAFNAALAVALIRGLDLSAAAHFGCRAAALIVQAPAFVEALHMWDGLDVAN